MRKRAIFAACLLAMVLVWLIPKGGAFSIRTAEGARRRDRARQERRRNNRRRQGRSQPRQTQTQTQTQVSGYAGGVVNLTNAERRNAGVRALGVDNELMAAAAQRAREMERRFDHFRPDGRSFESVLPEYRVKPHNWWGENILYNMSDKPADAVNWWMNSSGHRANILKKEYTHIGVCVYRSGGKTYVVQLFVGR